MQHHHHPSTREALTTYKQIVDSGNRPSIAVVVAALKACGISRDLESGKRIHSREASRNEALDVRVASTLVDMYSKCGNLVEARRVFEESHRSTSVVLWNCIIKACADNDDGELALQLFSRMSQETGGGGVRATFVTYLAVLRACAGLAGREKRSLAGGELVAAGCLEKGRILHAQAMASGIDKHTFVANSLVDMYAKCGSLRDAREVFDGISQRSVVSWTVMIQGYGEAGRGELALELFDEMQRGRTCPNNVTFVAVLKACASIAGRRGVAEGTVREVLRKGRSIHRQALELGYGSHAFVASSLVEMYARCGSMDEARQVFDEMAMPDLVSWTGMISGYAHRGDAATAIEFFSRMVERGIEADTVTFVSLFHALGEDGQTGKVDKLARGREVLARVVRSGLESDTVLANCAMDFYAKSGCLIDAQHVFDGMRDRDIVSWNCLVSGYSESGGGEMGMEVFQAMLEQGWKPDAITYLAALKACVSLAESWTADERKMIKVDELRSMVRRIHNGAFRDGFERDVFVASRLVETYAKCGSIQESREVFERMERRDLVCWNCLISGYVDSGQEETAFELYHRMVEKDGFFPNAVTLVALLKACAGCSSKANDKNLALERTTKFHLEARRYGLEEHTFVSSSLIDSYTKCGSLVDARRIFDKLSSLSIAAWTAIIRGHAEVDEAEEALDLYSRMKISGALAAHGDGLAFAAVIKACASLGALETGRKVEAEVRNAGLHYNLTVANSLIDFYAKSGSITEAVERFSLLDEETRDIVSWNSMIDGYSRQGDAAATFEMFERLEDEDKLRPNEVTFLSVLAACNHAGLVTEGKSYFEKMVIEYGLKPSVKHYGLMVNLLGRANKLDEALVLVEKASVDRLENVVVLWMSLLDGCWNWKNTRVGKICVESLQRLEKLGVVDTTSGSYVLMSNYMRQP